MDEALACLILVPLNREVARVIPKGPRAVDLGQSDVHGVLVDSRPASISARDRQCLSVVIRDLMDPLNPVYDLDSVEKASWPKEIVIHTETLTVDVSFGADTLGYAAEEQGIPVDLVQNWRIRNSGTPARITPWNIKTLAIRFVDLDKISGDESTCVDYGSEFRRRFPDALGFVQAHLPGYGVNGTQAVLVVSVGPAHHPVVWVHRLARNERGWCILSRYRQVFE